MRQQFIIPVNKMIFILLLLSFGSTAQTTSAPPISLDELVGINFWWDNYGKHLQNPSDADATKVQVNLEAAEFFKKLEAVGFIREFHDWYIHEGISNECENASESPSPLYPNNQYKFRNPYQYQASGINQDVFYECMLNEFGDNYCADMLRSTSELVKEYVGETCGAAEALERIPVNGTNKFDKPQSYKELAAYLYQFAYRYGQPQSDSHSAEKEAQIRANLHPDSHSSFDQVTKVSSVTSNPLRYIEVWNEPDQWWRENHIAETYIEPQEYAAMLSAAADGHAGQMLHETGNYPVGMLNADPNIRVVLGGLAELNPCYVEDMLDWLTSKRPNQSELPFHVINYHHYTRNGGVGKEIEDFCEGEVTNYPWEYGISPEEEGLKEKLRSLRQRLESHSKAGEAIKNMEFWLSEFGYETHPGSIQAAIPELDPVTGQANFRQNLESYRNLWASPAFNMESKEKVLGAIELAQAQWLLRTYLEVAAAGWQRAIAYEFGDRAVKGDYQNMGYNSDANRGEFPLFQTSGLFYFDPTMPPAKRYQPKMSYFYVKSFKTLATDFQFVTEQKIDGVNATCADAVTKECPRIYQFTKGEEEVLRAIWLPTSNGSRTQIELPLAENEINAQLVTLINNDEDGVVRSIEVRNGIATIPVSETPIFIKTTLKITPQCDEGDSCDDDNPCTINDRLDADCNCTGTFADADNDGICDVDDLCPNGDDTIDANGNGTPDACEEDPTEEEDDDDTEEDDDTSDDPEDLCNQLEVKTIPTGVVFQGLEAPKVIVKIFDPSWQVIYECNGFVGDVCESGLTVPLEPGLHNIQVMFFDENDQQVCIRDGSVIVRLDGECEDIGNSCNDGDNCTTNDRFDEDCNCVGVIGDDSPCNDDNESEEEEEEEEEDDDDDDDDDTNNECEVGDTCDDGNSCTVNDRLDADCNCVGLMSEDSDNDGVCDSDDQCANFNDNIDQNGNGVPDGCEFSDMMDCNNIALQITPMHLAISGMTGPAVVAKVFDPEWRIVYMCSDYTDNPCDLSEGIDLPAGNYFVQVQFYDAEGALYCLRDGGIMIPMGDDEEEDNNEEDTDNDNEEDSNTEEEEENCTLVGQFCDDGDACTSNDRYDEDCNCTGTIADSDNDGICDVEDICPNGDDNLDSDQDGIPDACDQVGCHDLSVSIVEGKIEISGITAPIAITKVFDRRYKTVYECSGFESNDCEETQLVEVENAGNYFIEVQFFDENKNELCTGDFAINVPSINNSDDHTGAMPPPIPAKVDPTQPNIEIGFNDHNQRKAGLNRPLSAEDLTLFPNPTTGILTIKSKVKMIDWRIYDNSGREMKVYQPIGAYEWTLSVADLPAGMYLVHLRDKDGRVTYGRFVKN